MKETLRITSGSQSFIVTDLIRDGIVMYVCYLLVVTFYDPALKDVLVLPFIAGYCIAEFIPILIVHIQYLAYNQNLELRIDKIYRTMTIIRNGTEERITFDQIRHAWIVRAPRWGQGEMRGFILSDRYRYAIVELEDGRRIVITCLLVFDLAKFFRGLGITITEHRVIYPWVSMNRYKPKPRNNEWVD